MIPCYSGGALWEYIAKKGQKGLKVEKRGVFRSKPEKGGGGLQVLGVKTNRA